ncbi:MAG: hypothetical protein ACD_36C00179G0002 [uncultured bacterium]|nr:MAG: hypothetical protein ACD_36C00179G0002 [uncultured bacterium]
MINLECLRDCEAACCKKQHNHRVTFDFNEQEGSMFQQRGVILIPHEGGGFTMQEDCIFLQGKLCTLHGQPTQPKCCVDNKAGEELCLRVRESVAGKRWSEVE